MGVRLGDDVFWYVWSHFWVHVVLSSERQMPWKCVRGALLGHAVYA